MKRKRLITRVILVFVLLAGFGIGWSAAAQTRGVDLRNGPLLIQCDVTTVVSIDGVEKVTTTNPCTIDHFLTQFVILAQWGMSIVAVLGVLMIVYGGWQWITAGGRASKIDEGKRIVQGTIIGIIISMMAYIIVNFTVAAITGTTARWNPFGPIATVFQDRQIDNPTRNINRPFSGTGGGGTGSIPRCNAEWDNGCTNQIRCADRDERSGAIRDLQTILQGAAPAGKGCNCGGVDGCFGAVTAGCVRDFQLANNLPPTGMIDQRTRNAIESPTSESCSSHTARINAVTSKLPTFSTSAAAGKSGSTMGCCLVKGAVNNNTVTLQCANQISERACAALGANNRFFPGETCFQNSEARGECGFCANTVAGRCFQAIGQAWCNQMVAPINPLDTPVFNQGPCFGSSMCGNGCVDTLYGISPF